MKKRILYILAGLFSIWVVGTAISLITGTVKIKINEGGEKPDSSKRTDDGPYLTFKGDYALLGYFKNGNYVVARKAREDLLNRSIEVITDKPEDKFSITIQNRIDIPPFVYAAAPKILAVSDIEGNFYALKKILKDNHVIDTSFKWIYGNNHIVILGDLVDRGLNVTQCLWLIYSLENQAKKAGGGVHFILGNHETMVMAGDVRYTRKKYIELAEAMNLNYSKDVLGVNSEIGEWLRSKNIIEKIGTTLFVHGGISEDILEEQLTLEDINHIARQYYGASEDSIQNAVVAKKIFGQKGPLWYRGIPEEKLSSKEVASILQYYGVENIVFGHSLVEKITGFYDNRMIGIDLIQPAEDSTLPARALLIENKLFYEVVNGKKRLIDQ